jgi:hypothetical protein
MKNDVRPCKFILLFQGRTGSTYITERVDAHPRVKMEPEVWGGWGFQLSREKIPLYSQKQLDWLMSFYDKDYNIPYSAIGFKTKLDDFVAKM